MLTSIGTQDLDRNRVSARVKFYRAKAGTSFFETAILLFPAFQLFGLIHAKSPVLPFPAILGLFADAQLPTGILIGHPFARLYLDSS